VNANIDFEYITWRQMLELPSIPRETLRMIDGGGNPNVFELPGGKKLIPDGNPSRIFHKATNKHINIIDEYDRDTEPLTTTKDRRAIGEKFDKYLTFFDKSLYRERYGFSNCFLRIVTISRQRMLAMMRLYEDQFPKMKYPDAPRKNILFAHFNEDPFYAR